MCSKADPPVYDSVLTLDNKVSIAVVHKGAARSKTQSTSHVDYQGKVLATLLATPSTNGITVENVYADPVQ